MAHVFLAQFGQPDDWMPFLVAIIVFLIPIIAILTSHQQKMARIFREQLGQGGSAEEIAALRAEVARLTHAVHQNTIALDSLVNPPGLPALSEAPPTQISETRRISPA